MKKKLEAELISIAHRILKLKNKSELIQLHQESQKLYEKLSVLLFVEENFTGAQPTIGRSEAYEVLETAFDENEVPGKVEMDVQEEIALEAEKAVEETPKEETETVETAEEIKVAEEEAETQPESEQEKVVVGEIELSDEELEEEETAAAENEEEAVVEEPEEEEESVTAEEEKASEETKEEVIEPAFELAFDKKEDVEEVAKESGHQIIFEDFLGSDYKDLEFVKAEIEEKHKHDHDEEPVKEEVKEDVKETKEEIEEEIEEEVKEEEPEPVKETVVETPKPAVEKVTKGITIGLNDRVGFVNHLFGGSNEDFNRVLSQLNTFDMFQDAKNFIEDLVKPDYNEWKGKEDYAERFLEVVENKFK
ncbi:hypothetical protein MH928_02260 [Flavobacterium sp. WW92]|uniref:hypothetical protein n=1 Tax=unclassified Flavobacterium TaxID=196869 RepID=UPI00222470FF|nr:MULTISPECIES: hypothetical protein [unclassified Flavobacterium]WDO13534.1 hypothetical protein MH928_02260 [Flavobacterium sp. WW92]